MLELPKAITPEWLAKHTWKEFEVDDHKICEFGLVMKNPTRKYGRLIYPTKSNNSPAVIRVPRFKGDKIKEVFNLEDTLIKYFNRIRNDGIFSKKYLREMALMSMDYNARFLHRDIGQYKEDVISPDRKKDNEQLLMKKRKCAGTPGVKCDRMVYNYRCDACWLRMRGGMDPDLYDDGI